MLPIDTPSISAEQVVNAEKLVNKYIREARPVMVNVYEASDPELKKVQYAIISKKKKKIKILKANTKKLFALG